MTILKLKIESSFKSIQKKLFKTKLSEVFPPLIKILLFINTEAYERIVKIFFFVINEEGFDFVFINLVIILLFSSIKYVLLNVSLV
jgi:hypothetical protein